MLPRRSPGALGAGSWFWEGPRKKLEKGTNCLHQGANRCQAPLAATANRKREPSASGFPPVSPVAGRAGNRLAKKQ